MRKNLWRYAYAIALLVLSLPTIAQQPDVLRVKSQIKKGSLLINASQQDIDAASVRTHKDERSGFEYAYMQQEYAGLKVWNQIITVALKNDQVISSAGKFIPQMENKKLSASPAVDRNAAIQRAVSHLNGLVDNRDKIITIPLEGDVVAPEPETVENISSSPIQTELVWLPQKDGANMRLCWNVQIERRRTADILNIRIDARTGEFVEKDNLTVHEHFGERGASAQQTAEAKKHFDFNKKYWFLPPTVTGASYNVIRFPLESPLYGTNTAEVNPWLLAGAGNNATTNGWHFDGTNNFSTTQGNNVHAYLDLTNTNVPSATNRSYTSTTAIPSLTFNGTFASNIHPTNSGFQDFALTNLFYWNNLLHDVLYQYGFNEAAGNFQTDNLGRGGLGNDYVRAEAQDANGFNNANFGTNVDGLRPRMQMYIWLGDKTFTVNSPGAITGNKPVVESYLGPNNKLFNLGPITGNLVLYNNASNLPVACTAPTNAAALNGNIALVELNTSSCTINTQISNVQATGARALVFYGNAAFPNPVIITGWNLGVTIPVLSISQVNGIAIRNQLTSSAVNVTMSAQNELDGDLDNGIISHEYGHGVSTRLTGGPANASCLQNAEQAGEGWSDFIGLMMTTNWATAQLTDGVNAKGIGNYALNQTIAGPGIRQYPYSTNMSVNPLTYANLPTVAIPHGVGTIWCSALWDMTWNIINQQGTIEPNIYNASSNGGNAIAFRLVMEGMKLQVCSPGFINSRDAILQADVNLYGGVHRCAIWRAFARRGMGYSATQGSSNNNNDQTVAYDLPPVTLTCPATQFFCYNNTGLYVVPSASTAANNAANDNCASLQYDITGATTRSGFGANASGAFNVGVSTITWTVVGTSITCQTTVTVDADVTASIPDAFALASGTLPNTVYIGYAPASSITLNAVAGGGTPGYTYLWSTGSTASSITVSPTITTTYTVLITDSKGCSKSASKTVNVMDIRCGNKLDKVTICHKPAHPNNTLCVAASSIPDHLSHGDMLGACDVQMVRMSGTSNEVFAVSALPNPAQRYFTVTIAAQSSKGIVSVQVSDMQGRLIERRENVKPNSSFTIGESYRTGVYLIDIIQGDSRQQLKLFKVN